MPTSKKNRDQETPASAPHKDKPVRVIRIGSIRGNVWANRLPSGQLVYNVTLDRLWRADDEIDEGGEVIKSGEWHQSQSFGRDDLLVVAKVADLCHTWIYRKIQGVGAEQGF